MKILLKNKWLALVGASLAALVQTQAAEATNLTLQTYDNAYQLSIDQALNRSWDRSLDRQGANLSLVPALNLGGYGSDYGRALNFTGNSYEVTLLQRITGYASSDRMYFRDSGDGDLHQIFGAGDALGTSRQINSNELGNFAGYSIESVGLNAQNVFLMDQVYGLAAHPAFAIVQVTTPFTYMIGGMAVPLYVGDFVVGFEDLTRSCVSNFPGPCSGTSFPPGAIAMSGDYDYNDLVFVVRSVPEPASMALVGMGLLGGLGLRRRGRKAASV